MVRRLGMRRSTDDYADDMDNEASHIADAIVDILDREFEASLVRLREQYPKKSRHTLYKRLAKEVKGMLPI